jgi:hypothetical protein
MKIAATIAAAVLFAGPAAATEIDLSSVLMGADGKAFMDCDHVNDDSKSQEFGKCDKWVPLTMGRFAAGSVDRNDKDLKPADIVIRGSLARKIRAAMDPLTGKPGKLDLDPRDIDLIHDQMAKSGLPPSVITQGFDLLMPPPATK